MLQFGTQSSSHSSQILCEFKIIYACIFKSHDFIDDTKLEKHISRLHLQFFLRMLQFFLHELCVIG